MLKGIQLTLMAGPAIPLAVPRSIIDGLLEATVTVSAGQISAFELKFRLSQRSPLHSIFLLSGGGLPKIFRVVLIATLNGRTETLINGVVTNHQVSPGTGQDDAVLTVTGEDLTRVLDYLEFTGFPYPAMPIEARVAVILLKYAVLGITPKIIPSIIRDVSSPLDYVAHHQGTDLCYLKKLAAEVGYTFYLEPGGLLGTTAYFGPDLKVGIPQPALSMNMGVHTNVESVSFDFDNTSAVLPVVTVHEPITKLPIPIPIPDISPLNPPLGLIPPIPKRTVQIEGTAHLTPTKAVLRGLAAASRSSNAVTASGTLDVLRYGQILKARRLVGLRGVGLAFNGLYYVESVTHRIQPGQYKQDFKLSRNGLVSIVPRIPA